MFQITSEHICRSESAAGHPLTTIFERTVDHFGLTDTAVKYLLDIVEHGGVDLHDAETLAALDRWCLHRYNFSSEADERVRTALYLGLVRLGYPPKWHGARVDALEGFVTPVPLFHFLEEAVAA